MALIILYMLEPDNAVIATYQPLDDSLIPDAIANVIPAGSDYVVVDETTLPDAFYENAWASFDTDGNITIDMTLAKQIFQNKLNEAISLELQDLNAQYVIAAANRDLATMAALQTQKTSWYGYVATIPFDTITTISEVDSYWPSTLERPTDGY